MRTTVDRTGMKVRGPAVACRRIGVLSYRHIDVLVY
jgi:hypothetical protein